MANRFSKRYGKKGYAIIALSNLPRERGWTCGCLL